MISSTAESLRSAASRIDLERLRSTPLERDPFDYLLVPNFLPPHAQDELIESFPDIKDGGNFPVASLDCAPDFLAFLDELQSPAVTQACSEKFGIDLSERPTKLTLRGWSRQKDGRIHADAKEKLVTALIYLNRDWPDEGGRLRLLRGPGDFVAEVPPLAGTLLAFRCSGNDYHGYKRFVGRRASVQLNWVTHGAAAKRDLLRHGITAAVKKLKQLGR